MMHNCSFDISSAADCHRHPYACFYSVFSSPPAVRITRAKAFSKAVPDFCMCLMVSLRSV